MSGGFFPIDRSIFSSSIWITGTPEEKVLWLWLLGNRDDDGVVRQRELAIADGAKLPRATVDAALKKFGEPDPDSRTKANDGRRVDRTEEGFVRILNHELYYSKDYSTPRWRRWRDRQRANALANDPQTDANAPTPLATNDKDKDKDTNGGNGVGNLPGNAHARASDFHESTDGPAWTQPNPLVDRTVMEPKCKALARTIGVRVGLTSQAVIAKASAWKGRSQRLHVMTPDRLARTFCNLTEWARTLNATETQTGPDLSHQRGEPKPESP